MQGAGGLGCRYCVEGETRGSGWHGVRGIHRQGGAEDTRALSRLACACCRVAWHRQVKREAHKEWVEGGRAM